MILLDAVISGLTDEQREILSNDDRLQERVLRFINSWTVNDPQLFDMKVKSMVKDVTEIINENKKYGKK